MIDKFRSLNNDVNLLEQRRLKMDNNYQKQLHHIIKRMHDLSSNNTSNSSNELSQKTIEEIKKLLKDQSYLDSILLDGVEKANKIASKKIKNIKSR